MIESIAASVGIGMGGGRNVAGKLHYIVTVNRACTLQEALDECGCKQHVDWKVIEAAPYGEGGEVMLVFFQPPPSIYRGGWLSCGALEEEYRRRGLRPDLQAQIAHNAANPEFAGKYPNGCQWVNDGNYCCVVFDRWCGEREVVIYRCDIGWHERLVFAGVPQGP
jgi:hypothetical protein